MCRRPLAEWALRSAAVDQSGVDVRSGVKVAQLQIDSSGQVPRVTGVLTETDAEAADIVIDASGRRSPTLRSPTLRWLAHTGGASVGAVSPWLDVLEPMSDVYAMAWLQSTLTRLVRDGVAVVHGLHIVGDACSTTSPTYGRGLSLGTSARGGAVRRDRGASG